MISPAIFPFLMLMQAIPCDLNGDGKVNIADLQVMINAVLGVAACPAGQIGGGSGLLTGTAVATSPGPARLYLNAGPAPVNTVATDASGNAKTYDVVIYLDALDGKLKLLTAAGVVTPLQLAFGPNMSTAGNLVDVNTATMLSRATDQSGKNKAVFSKHTTWSQIPGGTLTAGTLATVTLTPCPSGVNGTDLNHFLYISGGVGTDEKVLISGGTCPSGLPTGTIKFTPASSHTASGQAGAWTIADYSPTAYIGDMMPALTEYREGMSFIWIPDIANTPASSLNLGVLGPLPLMTTNLVAVDASFLIAWREYLVTVHADPVSHLIDAFVVR